jgi:hypothetical protein
MSSSSSSLSSSSSALTRMAPFFRLRSEDGKEFYFLAARHELSSKELSAHIMAVVNTTSSLVTETTCKLNEEILRENGFFVGEEKRNSSWIRRPKNNPLLLGSILNLFFERYKIKCKESDDHELINPMMAHWLCTFAMRPNPSMDDELDSRFPSHHGLEGKERYQSLFPDRPGLPDLDSEIARFLKKKPDGLSPEDKDYLSGSIPVVTSVNLVQQRSLYWVDPMMHFLRTLKGPVLFVAGRLHFGGDLGMLSFLHKFGLEITKMSPTGTFEPCPELLCKQDEIQDKALKSIERYAEEYATNEINTATASDKISPIVLSYMGPTLYQHPSFLSKEIKLEQKGEDIVVHHRPRT